MSISELHPGVQSVRDEPGPAAHHSEANHRIANNLALVSALLRMQASAIGKKGESLTADQGAEMLMQAAVRVENVARLHRLLSNNDGEASPAGPYLSDICSGISGSLSYTDQVMFHDESGEARLAPERLNALGLFLTEALTNSFKYAHPAGAAGVIKVTFRRNGHNLELEIHDDGVGLPEGFDPHKDGGLGLRIMRSLTTQLAGKLSFLPRDFGVCVRLDVPVAVAVVAR